MRTDERMQELLIELTELGLSGMVSFLNEKYVLFVKLHKVLNVKIYEVI